MVLRGLVCSLLLSVPFVSGTVFAAIDKDEQKCINALNKDGAKVAASQGKDNTFCIKLAGKGQLTGGQTADDCVSADNKGKVGKAEAKTSSDFNEKCGSLPSFGIPASGLAADVNAAAAGHSVGLLHDVFGSSLSTAVLDCDEDPDGCKCQQAVSKAYEKLAAAKLKEFVKCKKNALKEGKLPFPSGALSAAEIEACADDAAAPGSIANDGKQKIAGKLTKLGDAIGKKCGAPVNTFRAFPGGCAGEQGDDLRDCIDARVECRVCLTINLMDNLNLNCDVFDDGLANASCPPVVGNTIDIPSGAEPPNTPGTSGVVVTNPKLLTQFGGGSFDLNQARYTRFHFESPPDLQPDAILILVPGFEGGANDFKILAENLIPRVLRDYGLVVEVWAFDRRTNQLEDMEGLDIAELLGDPLVALDWLFGGELTLPLSPALVAGPNRRAQFYNTTGDVPFLANWTNLVFSRDIDAVVDAALAAASNQNVFLGGHSAGTGFTARYASTDFNLTGVGPADPGYAKLRGLVLLEGSGGTTAGGLLSADTLDRIEAKFDGGLFGAVRDNAPRCVDGTTPCTIATEATDCMGQVPAKCTNPTGAFSSVPGLLNPRILAASEAPAIQGASDPDTGENVLTADQGSAGNNAVAKVPDLATLAILGKGTAEGGIGSFVDDDGFVSGIASFVATSVGAPGPLVGGLITWLDINEAIPLSALPNNGPAPTSLPAAKWGQEKEVTSFSRFLTTFYKGGTNFTDWYYPSAGPSTTSVTGDCDASVCIVGSVGESCTTDAQCSQSVNLDSSALSIGRGRRDIENLTQAANIDIPVIGFGGSNGLVTVPASFLGFANSIATCTAPSCDGTPRVVDPLNPNPAFPTFGDVDGGFEVHISEGFAHVDVLTAEDDGNNNVLAPLAAFLARNAQ